MVKPVTLPDGRILALSITTVGRRQTMFARYSGDDGRSWTDKQRLFDFPEHLGGFGYFDALTDRDGEVHIFYLNDGNTGGVIPKSADDPPVRSGPVLDIWYVRSRQRRKQWDEPKRIWTGRAGDLLSVVQLRSGRLLLPICYMTERSWANRGNGFQAFTYVGQFDTSAIYSDDGGQTWQQSPDVLTVPVPDLSTLGGIEPVVIELKDGRVWMLIRTQMGRFYESYSSDGGTHWSSPEPSPIVSSDSPAALLRLHDGRLLMIWNEDQRYPYAYGGRQVLHAALSADEGRTWTNHREILRDPANVHPPPPNGDWGISYAFPAVTRSDDVIFSTWVETGAARSLFRLSPAWLEQTHQAADFNAGISDWSIFGTRGVELVPNADHPSNKVLSIRRADADWPSGAVWNFPMGKTGELQLRLRLNPGFGGTTLGLTDEFSPPFDDRDTLFNVFNVPIGSDGMLLSLSLADGKWHDLILRWNTETRQCVITVDGRNAGTIHSQRISDGIDYLRFHPRPDTPDGGLVVSSVEARVSPARPPVGVTPAESSGDAQKGSRHNQRSSR